MSRSTAHRDDLVDELSGRDHEAGSATLSRRVEPGVGRVVAVCLLR